MSSINLFELLGLIWKKRRFVIKVMVVFLIFGALIAVFSPKQFSSKTIILPQISGSQGLGKKLGGFAKLVGLNLDDNGKNEIFPTLYPIIATSIPFQKEILSAPIKDEKTGEMIPLTEYLNSIDLKEPTDYVKEYTVGLPGKVIGLFRSGEEKSYQLQDTTIVVLSRAEKEQIAYLENHVKVAFNDLEGFVEVSATLPDPSVSAQLTKHVQILLQDYIIEFNISKAQEELEYLMERHEEAREIYEEKRNRLGQFRDRNKNYISSISENRYEQLKTENDLAFNVYSQLANQLESAKLQVKRDTPVFTILKPVSIPLEPAGPSKIGIIILYVFFGLILGTFIVLARKFIPELKELITAPKTQ
ncbi:Wzz/FepE/Etk N-terminal domain-containing protein [Gilvibacter sediminis]|uniref:Wzz/FepE/Etk N-terminal domain-containing protein n=1 Tax=Gilvibacter sediminis TaxID=379071 RepID=UPI002350A8F6|nr:Wzz/FepE/Etk N-terminal domain-containing protein [Gilvibacter sediminis]MDC7999111.1 Wzz/FepE/Etk N-terminal domain-containing protein [Gilvibacter sediminis]